MTEVQQTLNERQSTHGEFSDQAHLSQSLKDIIRSHDNYRYLKPFQRESIEMILHKIARMLSGDPNLIDSARDVAGYAQLIVNELKKTDGAKDVRIVRQTVVGGILEDDQ